VPVHLFAGTYDELADQFDVERLYSELTGSPNVTLNIYPYGHLTYMWGLQIEYIYEVMNVINSEAQVPEINGFSETDLFLN